MNDKEYLGDGVYASFDGNLIWIDFPSGELVMLDYQVWKKVAEYGEKMYQAKAATPERESEK